MALRGSPRRSDIRAGHDRPVSDQPSRFPAHLLHAAATLYYLEDATQAQIAERLGTSRPTVSRLLSEARRQGIVKIEVVAPPEPVGSALEERLAAALGLTAVAVGAAVPGVAVGAALAPALGRLLLDVGLTAGDVLLLSSGRTVYEAAQARLPSLPGVRLAPTIGGQDEPEPWYQTNEIIRAAAARVGGVPTFLYTPALPGVDLHRSLLRDESIGKVLDMWQQARCVVMGVGPPPLTRSSVPRFLPQDITGLRDAVGDVCSRFYDDAGRPVAFAGDDRLMAIRLEALRELPVGIAVATGEAKVRAIAAGARAGYFDRLVTDEATAAGLLALSDGLKR